MGFQTTLSIEKFHTSYNTEELQEKWVEFSLALSNSKKLRTFCWGNSRYLLGEDEPDKIPHLVDYHEEYPFEVVRGWARFLYDTETADHTDDSFVAFFIAQVMDSGGIRITLEDENGVRWGYWVEPGKVTYLEVEEKWVPTCTAEVNDVELFKVLI